MDDDEEEGSLLTFGLLLIAWGAEACRDVDVGSHDGVPAAVRSVGTASVCVVRGFVDPLLADAVAVAVAGCPCCAVAANAAATDCSDATANSGTALKRGAFAPRCGPFGFVCGC